MGSESESGPVEPSADELMEVYKLVRDYMLVNQFGGNVTLALWMRMPDYQKGAMIKSAQELRAELALQISMAIRSELGMLSVASEIDGGDRLVKHTLRTAVADYIARKARRGA